MPVNWEDIAFSDVDGGFAYVRGRMLVHEGADRALIGSLVDPGDDLVVEDGPIEGFWTCTGLRNPLRVVAHLRARGTYAQPDHVLFADACGCCCPPHPALGAALAAGAFANPVHATPVHATPVHATPVHATPVHATAVSANPVHATSLRSSGPRHSTVRPASPPLPQLHAGGDGEPRITVLDTGVTDGGPIAVVAARIVGDRDEADVNRDDWLDPVAGHGTFIAGLIEQRAPGCRIEVRKVIAPQGQGEESVIAPAIVAEANRAPEERPAILNLSFSGYVWEQAGALAAAVHAAQQQGIVVVASAGNDATCRRTYPAALPEVVSVGAIGPDGPAPFTNYGDWVRACAPGVDIVSTFFEGFDGRSAPYLGVDADRFQGWARWSGTSFAAPTVVAAIVREMRRSGVDAPTAVEGLLDAPWLGRIPGLGTVVNV